MDFLKETGEQIGYVTPAIIGGMYFFAIIFTAVVMLGGGNG